MDKKSIRKLAEGFGGIVNFSLALGLSRGAVSQWEQIPIDRVAQVEKLTGVPREILRPDFFNRETA